MVKDPNFFLFPYFNQLFYPTMKLSSRNMLLLAAAIMAIASSTHAFAPTASSRRVTELYMAPRFDKSTQRWYTDDPAEQAGASYGPVGSLYRAGPKPFLQRIFNPDTYDQAVLKYMVCDCDPLSSCL
jgi:hypothetical protein